MEITNANAGVLLPYIAAQLRDCTFFAVDLEFSGIDRDGTEAGADAPAELVESLMREPRDMYPKKLEALKNYSIIQIGFSIFTHCSMGPDTSESEAVSAARQDPFVPTTKDLAADVKDFVPDFTAATYYTRILERVVQQYSNRVRHTAAESDQHGLTTSITSITDELAHVAQQLVAAAEMRGAAHPQQTATKTGDEYATSSVAELLRREEFLETLLAALLRRSREAEQAKKGPTPSGTSFPTRGNSNSFPRQQLQVPLYGVPPPTVKRYRVHTFVAYMFPAVLDEAHSVSLNVSTAEFLVKNNIDLTRWVRDGLRFKPLLNVASELAAKSEARRKAVQQMTQPHKALSHFTECFSNSLDALLPLSDDELRLVKFVLELHQTSTPSRDVKNALFLYRTAVRPLILFSRGDIAESALPESIYLKDKLYRDEMAALAAIGVGKSSRKYVRLSRVAGGVNSCSNNTSSSPSCASEAVCSSSVAMHGWGTMLLETLLYATEVLQKPIIFFNGYTDLLFFLLALYGPQRMPPTLQDFKSLVHHHFPVVYDTRVLACASPLQEHGNFTGKLSRVVEETTKKGMVAPHVVFEFDSRVVGGDDPALSSGVHNAGYDAMLTGKLFASLTHTLERAGANYDVYENFLATYNTLLSINLTEPDDGVLQEEDGAPVFFLETADGLSVDAIRDALKRADLTALVVFRGNGYTIHPVGSWCQKPELTEKATMALSELTSNQVRLLPIEIRVSNTQTHRHKCT
jgi:hypothetical protein